MSHPKYEYNGRIVPSVTTILGVVDKNLVRWAYNLGKSGVVLEDYQKYVNNVGTLTHYFIETYLKGSKADPEYVKTFGLEALAEAKLCFGQFYNWSQDHNIKPVATELRLTGENYGGTLDALVMLDGSLTILDWKTSKMIYPNYYAQLAAYHDLLVIDGKYGTPTDVGVLLLPKEGGATQYQPISTASTKFAKAQEYFKACLALYNAKYALQNARDDPTPEPEQAGGQ